MRQHAVPGVAARADRRHHQALLVQPLAVDAVLVALKDLLLRDVVRPLDLGAFGVALGAHLRDVERRDGRVGIGQRHDIVVAVAVLAQGGVRIAGPGLLPVGAGPVGGERAVLILVALAAHHALEPGGVRVLLDARQLGVARHAVRAGVYALVEAVRVDVQRNRSPGALDLQPGCRVAFEAVIVGLGAHRRRGRERPTADQTQRQHRPTDSHY